jgi:hypothetical protein
VIVERLAITILLELARSWLVDAEEAERDDRCSSARDRAEAYLMSIVVVLDIDRVDLEAVIEAVRSTTELTDEHFVGRVMARMVEAGLLEPEAGVDR